mgnify:CR=1 FL=1
MKNLEEKYEIYCNEIFNEGLDDVDYTSETFVTDLIDNSILLELRGWTKNDEKLSYQEFCDRLESDQDEYINQDGRFSHQKLTFKERWS